ncbi:excisionase family protein [Providencia rettgeri]|uniref:excisionase family protein n=1 Tax=Providencia rettgeri TaxID=587 RepID=UPI001BAA3D82|nr:excisionase family protein [Providencia rettgeri]MBS0918118.1 excisionase family protein [Providencia rettgeri]
MTFNSMSGLEDGDQNTKQFIVVAPNEWVTEKLLSACTGYSIRKIRSFREKSWRQGKEWLFVATDGTPKDNSGIAYNLPNINKWIAMQNKSQPRYERKKTPAPFFPATGS